MKVNMWNGYFSGGTILGLTVALYWYISIGFSEYARSQPYRYYLTQFILSIYCCYSLLNFLSKLWFFTRFSHLCHSKPWSNQAEPSSNLLKAIIPPVHTTHPISNIPPPAPTLSQIYPPELLNTSGAEVYEYLADCIEALCMVAFLSLYWEYAGNQS